MRLPGEIRIIEVSPRDGLQNEPKLLSTAQKVEFINGLSECGFKQIEVGSFVSAQRVPQLADTETVLNQISLFPAIDYSVLICNYKGLERVFNSSIGHIALFTSASETFCQHNINRSINESLTQFKRIIHAAHKQNISIRVYISCAFDCPYEGTVTTDKVLPLVIAFYRLHCAEIVLADTTGKATPLAVYQLLKRCLKSVPADSLAVHFHDTYGRALANIYCALESGIERIDSSLAGLGGCPFAPGASGNVATEDLLYMLHSMNISTGIDLQKSITLGNKISSWLQVKNQSRISTMTS